MQAYGTNKLVALSRPTATKVAHEQNSIGVGFLKIQGVFIKNVFLPSCKDSSPLSASAFIPAQSIF